jgi:hypothetical protein
MLFVAPELLMGNRVLRFDSVNYPVDRFLRLVFRDDDMGSVHATSVGPKLIDKFVGKALEDGINIAGNILIPIMDSVFINMYDFLNAGDTFCLY